MPQADDLSVAILAGGASARMGRDKAALPIGGEIMLARTARLALKISERVCIVGREGDANWPRDLRVDWAQDDAGAPGPLGGLLGALKWSGARRSGGRVLLLPCDLPKLEMGALQWIATASSTCTARDGLATTREGELEPMFSIYFAGVGAHARKYLGTGRRSLHGLIESGDFATIECPPQVAAQIFNCNTPEDWRRATSDSRTRS